MRRATVILAIAASLLAMMALYVPAASAAAPQIVVQSIDASRYPEIGVKLLLPSDLPDGRPSFSIRENGEVRKVTAVADAGSVERKPLAVVLVVDTSGSMRGTPLEEAKRAANAFVSALRPDDEVAVVSFSDKPQVALAFTTDRASIADALNRLGAGGETALFDSVILAEKTAVSNSLASRSLVVLSDGGDTASTAARPAMLQAVSASRLPVYTLGLKSPEADPAVLEEIARQSRGRTFSVADAASLTSAYGSVAREIQNGWTLSFDSAMPNTKDLDIDVSAQVGSTVRKVALSIPNPALLASIRLGDSGIRVTPMTLGIAGILVVAVLVFGTVTLLSFVSISAFRRPPTTISQLAYYGDTATGATPPPRDTVTARMLDAVGSAATERGITAEVEARLARAGLPLRPLEYMFLHVGVVCIAGIVTQMIVSSFALSVAVVLVATIAPFVALDTLAERRKRNFHEQLPQVLGLLAGSLRAGYGLLQGVELIVKEMGPPTSVEFGRVVTESRLGLPVEAALEKMARRMGSEDFLWAVSAVGIQREVGGNLAEVLDIVGTTIRERDALRRHIRGLTAEGRLSAVILSILPFAVLGAMIAVAPSYIGALFNNPGGMFIGALAVSLLGVGLLWLRQIIRIEV